MNYCTCVCKFDEAEDNVIQWCATHSLALTKAVTAEREACAELVDREAGIAHDDWNDRNLARQLSHMAEQIRTRK